MLCLNDSCLILSTFISQILANPVCPLPTPLSKKAHINLLTNQTSNYEPTKPQKNNTFRMIRIINLFAVKNRPSQSSPAPASSAARRASCSAWIWASTSSWPGPRLGQRDASNHPERAGPVAGEFLELHPELLNVRNLGTNRFSATPKVESQVVEIDIAELVGFSWLVILSSNLGVHGEASPTWLGEIAAYPNFQSLRGSLRARKHIYVPNTRATPKGKRYMDLVWD